MKKSSALSLKVGMGGGPPWNFAPERTFGHDALTETGLEFLRKLEKHTTASRPHQ